MNLPNTVTVENINYKPLKICKIFKTSFLIQKIIMSIILRDINDWIGKIGQTQNFSRKSKCMFKKYDISYSIS